MAHCVNTETLPNSGLGESRQQGANLSFAAIDMFAKLVMLLVKVKNITLRLFISAELIFVESPLLTSVNLLREDIFPLAFVFSLQLIILCVQYYVDPSMSKVNLLNKVLGWDTLCLEYSHLRIINLLLMLFARFHTTRDCFLISQGSCVYFVY